MKTRHTHWHACNHFVLKPAHSKSDLFKPKTKVNQALHYCRIPVKICHFRPESSCRKVYANYTMRQNKISEFASSSFYPIRDPTSFCVFEKISVKTEEFGGI